MKYQLCLTLLLIGFVGTAAGAQPVPPPGTVFRDCPQCPEMIVIPPGVFTMGETGHSRETPLHSVSIRAPFAIGRFTVTFEEWAACLADGGCAGQRPSDAGWGGGRRPVINVSWDEAQGYVAWLARKSGRPYRLPSEAEFEYVARAGTTTDFWWGSSIGQGNANCDGCGSAWDNRQTAPVGSFKANPFGVYDTAGNVTQWMADRWNSNYVGAPTDGSAWMTGDPRRVVMRSGSWFNGQARQHAAFRNGDAPIVRNSKIGFRVARSFEGP